MYVFIIRKVQPFSDEKAKTFKRMDDLSLNHGLIDQLDDINKWPLLCYFFQTMALMDCLLLLWSDEKWLHDLIV